LHLKNLNYENCILINGKKYVKVNLKFVDTLNSDSTSLLFNLEEENDTLKYQIEKLTSENILLRKKNQDIEILNINLLNDNRNLTKTLNEKNKKNQNDNTESKKKLNEIIKENETLISSLQSTLLEKDEIIQDKTVTIQRLLNNIKMKGYENETLKRVMTEWKEEETKKTEGKRELQKKICRIKKEFQKELSLKENLITEKDMFIRIISDKILDSEKNINDLKKHIEHIESELEFLNTENHYR